MSGHEAGRVKGQTRNAWHEKYNRQTKEKKIGEKLMKFIFSGKTKRDKPISILLALTMVISLFTGIIPSGITAYASEAPICITISFFQGDEDDGAAGKWLVARQSFEVAPGLAASYGFEYGSNIGANDVSTLDALVAAHIPIFGDDIGDIQSALSVSYGTVTTAMAVETDGNFVFSVNGKSPHDGVAVFWQGFGNQYTGYTVDDAVIHDGDVVEFILLADDGMWGMFTSIAWFEHDGQRVDEVIIEPNENLDLTLNGLNSWYIYNIPSEQDAHTVGVDEATVAIVNISDGGGYDVAEFGSILGETDDGDITLSFENEGVYIISAYVDADWGEYIVAPWLVVTVEALGGTDPGDDPGPDPIDEPTDVVTVNVMWYDDNYNNPANSSWQSPIRISRADFTVERGYASNTFGYSTTGLTKYSDRVTVFDLLAQAVSGMRFNMSNNPPYYLRIEDDGTLITADQYAVGANRPFYAIINGKKADIDKLDQTALKDGDEVLFLFTRAETASTYLPYALSWFEDVQGSKTADMITMSKSASVTLKLKGSDVIAGDFSDTPLAGVPIGTCGVMTTGADGALFTQFDGMVTGNDGSFTVSFDKSGSYVLTAFGATEYNGKSYQTVAQCKIIVTDNASADIDRFIIENSGSFGEMIKLYDDDDSRLYLGRIYSTSNGNFRILGYAPPGAEIRADGVLATDVDEDGFFSISVPSEDPTDTKHYYKLIKIGITSADKTATKEYTVMMCYGKNNDTSMPKFGQSTDNDGVFQSITPTTNSWYFNSADGTTTLLRQVNGHAMSTAVSNFYDNMRIIGEMDESFPITDMRFQKLNADGSVSGYFSAVVEQFPGSPFTSDEVPLDLGLNCIAFEIKPEGSDEWIPRGLLFVYRDKSDAKTDVSFDINDIELTDVDGNVITPVVLDKPEEHAGGEVYWTIRLPAGADQNRVTAKLLSVQGGGVGTTTFYYGSTFNVGATQSTTLGVTTKDLYNETTVYMRFGVQAENKISQKFYQIRITRDATEPTEAVATAISTADILPLNSAGANQVAGIQLRKPGDANPHLPEGASLTAGGIATSSTVDISAQPGPTILFVSAAASVGVINVTQQSPIASIRINPTPVLFSLGATYSVVINKTDKIADHVKNGPFYIPHTGGYAYGVDEGLDGSTNSTLIEVIIHAPPGMDYPDRTYTFVVPKIAPDSTGDVTALTIASAALYSFKTGEGVLTAQETGAVGFNANTLTYDITANYNVDRVVFYPTIIAELKDVLCTVNGAPSPVTLNGVGKMQMIANLNVGENTVTIAGGTKTFTFKIIRGESYNILEPAYSSAVTAGKFSPTRYLIAIIDNGTTDCVVSLESENPNRTVTVTQNGQVIAEGTGATAATLDVSQTATVKVWDSNDAIEYSIIFRTRHDTSPSRTYAFMPAPGQFVNEFTQNTTGTTGGFGWGEGWDTSLYASGTELDGSASGRPGVSLGAFGGYIIYEFDDPIKNDSYNKYGTDFVITGNAFLGNNEPAGVMVAQKNADGEPDIWYNLAGSEHYEDTTDWNYEVTYTNPNPSYTPNIGESVPWKDNRGGSGRVTLNGFHTQIYYPNPAVIGFPGNAAMESFNPNSMTFSGVNINKLNVGFGYADTCTYDRNASVIKGNPYAYDFTAFDIAWAVDENGTPVELDEISFIKVFTSQQTDGGAVGEKSPEILLVSRSVAGTEDYGSTASPVSIDIIPTTGGAPINVPIVAGKLVYDVDLGEIRGAKISVNAGISDRIYVNNQRTVTGTAAANAYSVEAGKTRQVRVIAQNGEKEPYIILLNLTGSAPVLITGLKLERSGTNIALSPDGNLNYTASVNYTYGSVDVIPTVKEGASVTVNGQPLSDGKATVNLVAGATTQIVIVATKDGESDTTIIAVTRGSAPATTDPGDTDTIPGFGKIIGKATVYISNNTFPGGDFAGTIISESGFDIAENDTMMTVVLRALAKNGYGWTGSGGSIQNGVNDYTIDYLASITKDGKSLGEFSGDPGSGWMGLLNDWFVNEGFQQFKPANGDEISVEFTQNLGADLGGSWDNSDTSLVSLIFSSGTCEPAFDASITEYTLTLPAGTTRVGVTPGAANRNFLVKIFLNEIVTTNAQGSSYYQRGASIPVKNDDIIYIGVGEPAWPSMNNQNGNSGDYAATWYAVRISISGSTATTGSGDAPTTLTPSPTPTSDSPAQTVWSGETSAINWANPFSDVKDTDWFYGAVAYVETYGLMKGTDIGFEPQAYLTRAMLVTILYRAEGEPDSSGTPYTDVESGTWYTDAVAWADANDIVNGYGGGLFGPNDYITREQFALILYNYASWKGADVSLTDDLSVFVDAASVSNWAATAMRWAVAAGLFKGRSADMLVPNGTATRAEAATLLMRFIEQVLK